MFHSTCNLQLATLQLQCNVQPLSLSLELAYAYYITTCFHLVVHVVVVAVVGILVSSELIVVVVV